MIETKAVTRYTPVCEECGWRGHSSHRREYAERDLDSHPCGEHRQAHDSTGGFRGILGGYNVRCVCGESWVVDGGEPFTCPRTKPSVLDPKAESTPPNTTPPVA